MVWLHVNEAQHYSNHSLKQFRGSVSIELHRRRKESQRLRELQRNYFIQFAQNTPNENNAQNVNNPNNTQSANAGANQTTDTKTGTAKATGLRAIVVDARNRTDSAIERQKKRKQKEEDALERVLLHVGEMGWYQWYLFIWMLPFGFFFAWVYFVQMFIVATPHMFYCKIPELESLTQDERRDLSVPLDGDVPDKCHMYDVDWKSVLSSKTRPKADSPRVPCKHGWEYEFTDIHYPTVSTERNWVCSNAKNVPTSQAIFFVGALLGCFGFGWIADNYGRIPALMGSNLFGAIGGVATVFTSGYWDFAICRFISGMALDNNFMLVYILVLEYVGSSHRTWVANIAYALYFGGGNVTLPWIAYFCNDWRKTLWMTSLPMFVVILAPWFMPESARWLVSRGRVEKAVAVLRNFAAVNGNAIPDAEMNDFIVSANEELSEHVEESLFVIFHSGPMRHTAIYMLIVYCGSGIVYDALVRLSEAFGLNFFLTFTITGGLEIPAVLLLAVFLDKYGRRPLTWIPLLFAGITILAAIGVPKGLPRVCFAVVARFLMHMAFTAETQWATEILPTPFRASGSAALHMSAFAACLISPFIVYSRLYWQGMPLLILGIVSIFIAAVTLLLPETKGLEMPQTIPDAEIIIANNCLFPHVRNAKRRPSKYAESYAQGYRMSRSVTIK